jgi:hypothetical protein
MLLEFCGLAYDLDHIRNDLLPLVHAAPLNGVLEPHITLCITTMRAKAELWIKAGKQFIKGLRTQTNLCKRLVSLGELMKPITQDVLDRTETLGVFQLGIPLLVQRITHVLETEMVF